MASLEERLGRLRGWPAAALADDLVRRLERLRRPGARRHGVPVLPADLAHRLGTAQPAPGLLRLDSRWPLDHRHGGWTLGALTRPLTHLAPRDRPWLFLDTETSGLAGGAGTLAFLVGLAGLGDGHLWLRQYLLAGFGAEGALLERLLDELQGAGTLVSFNGKSFDLPMLATRLGLHRLPNPLPGLAHLDLLHPLRRRFGREWPDCRLATAERLLLGHTRNRDLPGAEVPGVWREWIQQGRGGRLAAVVRHNRLDLLSLALLLPALDHALGGTPPAARDRPVTPLDRWRELRRVLGANPI